MLKKIKILVPLDQPDILGVASKHRFIPDYKLVFEESMNLAKALDAEVVLLHIANRENKENSDKRQSDIFYTPEDLKDLKKITEVPEIKCLIEKHLPILELVEYAGAEVKNWKEGEELDFEITDEMMDGLRDLFFSRGLKIPEGEGLYSIFLKIPNEGSLYSALEKLLHDWSIRLTSQLQEPIQNLLVRAKYLLARAGNEPNNTRAMILMMDIKGRVICKAAQKWGMDLIVMGRGKAEAWHHRIWHFIGHLILLDFDSINLLLLDSSSTYVLQNTPCSVVLVDEHLQKVQEINKILVALDHSPNSWDIFLQAVNLAERIRAAKQSLDLNILDKDATPTLYLLHVMSPFEPGYPQISTQSSLNWDFDIAQDRAVQKVSRRWDKFEAEGKRQMQRYIAWAEERNIPVQYAQKLTTKVQEQVFTEFLPQPDALPGQMICEVATEWGANLIVLGYRREWELEKLILGSVCNYVTRHAPCSVFVVKGYKPIDIEPDDPTNPTNTELIPKGTNKRGKPKPLTVKT